MTENKEQFLQFMQACRVPHEIGEFVEVLPMTDRLKEMSDSVVAKGCYNNAYNYASCNLDSKYVIGYGAGVLPVEHAWVEVGGVYYDPTWEVHSSLGKLYYKIVEFTMHDLCDIILKNECTPPSLWDLAQLNLIPDNRLRSTI